MTSTQDALPAMLLCGARLHKTGSRRVASKTRRRRGIPCARSCEFRAARCCEWLGATAAPDFPLGCGGAVAPNAAQKAIFCPTKIDTRLTKATRRDILELLGHGQMSTATTRYIASASPLYIICSPHCPAGGFSYYLTYYHFSRRERVGMPLAAPPANE